MMLKTNSSQHRTLWAQSIKTQAAVSFSRRLEQAQTTKQAERPSFEVRQLQFSVHDDPTCYDEKDQLGHLLTERQPSA